MGAKIDRAPSTTVVFELVERCRYVTGGMEFDLTPLPSTADVSFVHNTPTPFVTHRSSSSSNFQMNFARSIELSLVRLAVVLCTSGDGV